MKLEPWFWACLGAVAAWGIFGFLPRLTVRYLDPRSAMVWQVLGNVTVALVLLIGLGRNVQHDPRGIGLALLTGLAGIGGALLYLFAVRSGRVAEVVTLTALYPIVSIALAWFFLGEALSPRQGLGVVLALAGLVLLVLK